MHHPYARRRSERGQGLTEYALILGLCAVVSLATLSALGYNTTEAIGNLPDAFTGTPPPPGATTCRGATLQQHLQHCPCSDRPHSCVGIGWSC
jgi:Flp pilus assembly pilin Flp